MKYRQVLTTDEEMAGWYDAKYKEMGGAWHTPPEDCNRHLDDAGVIGGSLLDVGCGGGHLLVEAAKRCVFVAGAENSLVAIGLTRERIRENNVKNWIAIAPLSYFKAERRFDYIISLGSLEHFIDLDGTLDLIRSMLLSDGVWYFYCPNELWVHEDQPNERTATDEEWIELFTRHGLKTEWTKRWGDNTAFRGTR